MDRKICIPLLYGNNSYNLHLYPGLVTGGPLPQLHVLLLQVGHVLLQLLAELQPAVRHLPEHGALPAQMLNSSEFRVQSQHVVGENKKVRRKM